MVAPINPDAPRKDDTVILREGVYRPDWKDPVPQPGTLGNLRDIALGGAQTAIDYLQSPATLIRDATSQPSGGDPDAAAAMQGIQHAAIDTKKWLGSLKTPYARDQEEKAKLQEEDEKGWMREVGDAVASIAPVAGVAYLGGPVAAGAIGLASAGATGLHLEEQLQNVPQEAWEKNDKYQQYRGRGMSDEQAKSRLYADMRNAGAILPDLVANTVFGGVAGRAISRLGSRGVAQTMRQRIMKNLAIEVPEGVGGGALSGAASEYSAQTSQIAGGLRDDYDTGQIQKAGMDIARPVAAITTAMALGKSARRPSMMSEHQLQQARQRAVWEAQQTGRDVRTSVLENQPAKEGTDEMGMDLRLVAADNLGTPKPQTPEQTAAGPAAQAARAPWEPPPPRPEAPPEAPPVAPAGPAPINPEGSTARVTPASTEIPPVGRDAGIPPATGETIAPPARTEPVAPPRTAEELPPARTPAEHPVSDDIVNQGGRDGLVLSDREAEILTREKLFDTLPDGTEALGQRALDRLQEIRAAKEAAPTIAQEIAEKVAARKAAREAVAGPAKAAAAAGAKAGVAAEGAKTEFTAEALHARAVDVSQTPDAGTLEKHIAEWKAANRGKKLSNQNEIRQASKAARETERKRIDAETRAKQKADKEARTKAETEAKAEKAHMGLAALQSKGFAGLAKKRATEARKQAEALKKKAKPEEKVTPEGKSEAKPETKAEPPPDEKPGPLGAAKIRETLKLKPKGEGVVHGKEAVPEIAKIETERGEAARAAWQPVIKGEKKAAETKVDTEGQAVRRDPKYTLREETAKAVVEGDEHKPGPNKLADLAGKEQMIRDGRADDTPVKEAVGELVKEAKAVVDDYKGRLSKLTGGKKDLVLSLASSGGESRATKKGDYHGFISDLNNYVRKVEKALAKGGQEGHLKAKELTLKYLEDTKAVREGQMATVVEGRDARNSAVAMEKRTYSNLEGKIELLSDKELEKLTPSERAQYDEDLAKAQTKVDQEEAGQARKTTSDTVEGTVEERLKDNPVKPITKSAAKAKGIPTPRRNAKGEIMRDRAGRMLMDDPAYPHSTLSYEAHYVDGKSDPLNEAHVDDMAYELDRAALDAGGDKLKPHEASSIFRLYGEEVQRGSAADTMRDFRPGDDQPHLQKIFDAVFDITADMPVEIWSRDMMEAYYQHKYGQPAPLAFYSVESGMMVYRQDTYTPSTVFHETIHGATSRAIRGSERLQALVDTLQNIIESRYKGQIDITAEMPFQVAIRRADGEKVNAREFIAELFSRPEVADLVKGVKLRPAEVRALNKLGYRADVGKSIMRSLWDGFLEAIGFKEKNPNAMKVSVDLLQDMFEREMQIRGTDEAFGRTTGAFLSKEDMANIRAMDPKGGPGLVTKWQARDFESVSRQLLDLNESGKLDDASSGTAIKLLNRVNQHYWGDDSLTADPSNPVPIRGPEAVRSDVENYLDSRFGRKARDAAWQLENKFRTPLRKFFSGMQYTNDIGNTLGEAFKNVVRPIKEAWSKREHYAQEYMDTYGANKLIDRIATIKHSIKDRQLWNDWERLLIRESYTKAYSDQPLGMGLNEHIKAGELKHRQTERDYAANKILLDHIAARNPELITLRNEIYDFSRKELDRRMNHQVTDMLLRENIVKHGDEIGLAALAKSVRRLDKTMTPEERKAMDRIVGDPDSKAHKDFAKKREDIRKIIDQFDKAGPHVPFMRHGKHAVFAEYDVRPDAGVKYNEVNPDKTGDLNKMYDFAEEKGAQDFIDKTLGHDEVQIALNDAYQVVYDKITGERARDWRVEHRDGNATTYTSEAAARDAMIEGDKLRSRDVTPEGIEQMNKAGLDTSHLEVRHRVVFNPTEFVRFESEREAHEFREQLNQRFDTSHAMAEGPRARTTGPNMTVKVTNVESPKTQVNRANVAYTSAELQQWINRIEASESYQSMTKDQQAEWKREMRIEAARVTMTAGRRTMHLPREYARGASTDILKNMIDFAGSNARAIAKLKYRDQIDKAVAAADAHNELYRYQSGGLGKDARARGEAMDEIKQRLYAPIRVEDSWATGIKRALQVSMIGHLADTGYLIINAMEPWVFGAAISASRHGWAGTYREMGAATHLIDLKAISAMAGKEFWSAGKQVLGLKEGFHIPANYEEHLIAAVTGPRNTRGDGAELAAMLRHMFSRGLVARDVGMEFARTYNPDGNWAGQKLDHVDNAFRAANTGIETVNRAMMAIANYRLERAKIGKDQSAHSIDAAHEGAVKYAEDAVFKGAGDYSSWNNPRYMNNPFLKLAGQFKKYPLRIFSVYTEALTNAFKGDREAQKQVAYMLLAQAVAAGGLGLPLASFGAGIVNAAYILGISDDNWDDFVFNMRKGLVDRVGVEGTDLALHGALRFSGADFSQKMSQGSIFFQGSPESRKPLDLLKSLALAGLGAPGDSGAKFIGGIQKIGQAAGHYNAGASSQAMETGIEGAAGILQVKIIANIAKAVAMGSGGYAGLPKGVEATTGQALIQAIGLQPTAIANKLEARRTINREKKKESEAHSTWVNRWVKAPDTEKAGIWAQIQKDYNAGLDDPRLRIKYQDLWKAKQRAKQTERRDDSKLGVKLSGRQKAFADHSRYFDVQ